MLFFDLELEQTLFYVKVFQIEIPKILLITITCALSLQRKTLPFFHALEHPLPTSRSILLF